MANVCILTGYGINADAELASAFRSAGGEVRSLHLKRLMDQPDGLAAFDLLAFPGGFSFGDHLGSGVALAGLIRSRLADPIRAFVERGGLVIGICNGFQVLVKSGLLPDPDGSGRPSASLVFNESGHFIDRWVKLRVGEADSPWLSGLDRMSFPIRHGEGRFVYGSEKERDAALSHSALHYDDDNPNGSLDDIAGVVDRTGRILGLMPHPEAAVRPELFPDWRREMPPEPLPARRLFENGVLAATRGRNAARS